MADLSPAEIMLDSLVPAQRLIRRLQGTTSFWRMEVDTMGIEQARKVAWKALGRTYEGRAAVFEYREVRNPDTYLTDFKEVAMLED